MNPTDRAAADGEYGQDDMAHRLPSASIVDRIPWLVHQCRDKRVIHVGFADAGYRQEQSRVGRWLHGHLDEVTSELVGLDTHRSAVSSARTDGFEAYEVDCSDSAAVSNLGLEPADIVLAGEVIEHLRAPGPFLAAMHSLCKPDGKIIVTTPNAYGLVNVVASMTRRLEVNHPDHVVMFTWRTLTQLLRSEGWTPVDAATYVPVVRDRGARSRIESVAVRSVLRLERVLGGLGRPFSADGLIVVARPASPNSS